MILRPLSMMAAALALAACSGSAPPEAPAVVEVLTIRVEPTAVTVADELPGRVVAYRDAEIRPQVGGIIQRRLFEQGEFVHAGQPLFQISPAPFRADTDTAAATVEKATAAYGRARVQAERLKPLVDADAISRQSFDDAVAARDQAAAELAEARATLRRRLDLGFARITAPISGRIGAANVTEGALVAAGDANPLATVQQIDRVYVDVRQPAERFAALREAAGGDNGAVTILTASGRAHPARGKILFSGIAVDPGTGDALVRVAVDNPGEGLLPGMFVRAKLPRVTLPAALTVPQQAVTRDANGDPQVSVVDGQDRVHPRRITVGDVVDGRYLVLAGLRTGERVIVVGQDRVQPGVPVTQRAWRPAQGN
ncbi:efflux RND transporter periplasmic adaptor subunit [Sphingobium cloacae]|uniref:Efflux transporter periplasmic adaptor subunit n=1 Tax=Sphingobium cloacae TaxID=120107 RepID=A0A1E1F1Q0_9SPHN|nr:efflux RND transporter periplasmic adaptor subunit [Sphingobium cloacae]BAV64420.1 efflux transporter periplasmic adaptor subunit [Sphingobium cloacae]